MTSKTNDTSQEKRGGKRVGSGRKPKKNKGKTYSFYLTAEQHAAVKEFIQQLRQNRILPKYDA